MSNEKHNKGYMIIDVQGEFAPYYAKDKKTLKSMLKELYSENKEAYGCPIIDSFNKDVLVFPLSSRVDFNLTESISCEVFL